MKTVALSVVAVLAVAGGAQGQAATAAATLNMRLVPVDVTSVSPLNLSYQNDTVHNTVADADSNRTRRFEVQYQITEGAGFEGVIASLASMQFSITSSVVGGSLATPALDRAILTLRQARTSTANNAIIPVSPTDTSGNSTGVNAGRRGLYASYRGGISPIAPDTTGNTLPSNGILAPGAINLITPLTLAALDQAPNDYPGEWFGLYAFEVTVGQNLSAADAIVNLAIAPAVDAQTGNAWGAYEAGPIPRTSQNFSVSGGSFAVEGVIPAPASVALIGLGGLVATRRRRA